MTTKPTPLQNAAEQLHAANGLALVRLTIGAMLVWVFFENLGKGLYTPAGYASLINYYIKGESLAGCLEGSYGFYGESCRNGGSYAGDDGNLSRDPARRRSADAPGRLCGISVPSQPLD